MNSNYIPIDAREELSSILSNACVKQETERHHSFKICHPTTKRKGGIQTKCMQGGSVFIFLKMISA